jgi:hypothetical protein
MRLYRCKLWDHVNFRKLNAKPTRSPGLQLSVPEHGGSRAVIVAIAPLQRRAVPQSLRSRLCFATAARVDVMLVFALKTKSLALNRETGCRCSGSAISSLSARISRQPASPGWYFRYD